jgi:hypothetical protein
MNPPKCDELDYIHFLVAAQKEFSNVEAAKLHPAADSDGPAHDAYTRLLNAVSRMVRRYGPKSSPVCRSSAAFWCLTIPRSTNPMPG